MKQSIPCSYLLSWPNLTKFCTFYLNLQIPHFSLIFQCPTILTPPPFSTSATAIPAWLRGWVEPHYSLLPHAYSWYGPPQLSGETTNNIRCIDVIKSTTFLSWRDVIVANICVTQLNRWIEKFRADLFINFNLKMGQNDCWINIVHISYMS